MHPLIPKLEDRWQQLLRSFGVSPTAAQSAFEALAQAYTSPHRSYHTLQHIGHVLQMIDCLQDYAPNLEIVQLAAWFHDIVYDTQVGDNEERSRDYAVTVLRTLGLTDRVIARIGHLILQTKPHLPDTGDRDGQVLLDADLAILGSNPEEYRDYAQAIRQEYGWVPEARYQMARKQVLKSFLQRPQIYFTPLMYEQMEAIARQNLEEEIRLLSPLGSGGS
ncbi:hypothetical protein BST81_15915 [Leptolyngbya sp. 'hensonii']|uniref:HD domain-containing protein n=1 Tax=Leptolyngbya sp. 'hensonii' TaxID=1922337 RepID=UPI00094F912B|nr:hypothetical protein [Leptolyngbya sp. 'hensonii']OLP17471.1 hypothetical protein BST81_15915 [Leptolyngbya sp. 'hensonii']